MVLTPDPMSGMLRTRQLDVIWYDYNFNNPCLPQTVTNAVLDQSFSYIHQSFSELLTHTTVLFFSEYYAKAFSPCNVDSKVTKRVLYYIMY